MNPFNNLATYLTNILVNEWNNEDFDSWTYHLEVGVLMISSNMLL